MKFLFSFYSFVISTVVEKSFLKLTFEKDFSTTLRFARNERVKRYNLQKYKILTKCQLFF